MQYEAPDLAWKLKGSKKNGTSMSLPIKMLLFQACITFFAKLRVALCL